MTILLRRVLMASSMGTIIDEKVKEKDNVRKYSTEQQTVVKERKMQTKL